MQTYASYMERRIPNHMYQSPVFVNTIAAYGNEFDYYDVQVHASVIEMNIIAGRDLVKENYENKENQS